MRDAEAGAATRAVPDVAILGAGPVGSALALLLHDRERSVVVVEQRDDAQDSAIAGRPIALSYASRLMLEQLGIWGRVPSTPIERIEVTQQGAFGGVTLEARESGVPALGYVCQYGALDQALRQQLKVCGVQVHAGTRVESVRPAADRITLDLARENAPRVLSARCVVHAEGRADDIVERAYRHDAVVARIRCTPSATQTAFERFTRDGPLALLPEAGGYALIWALPPLHAIQIASADDATFLRALQAAWGRPTPRFIEVRERQVQPLALRIRRSRTGVRQVSIGNAAQGLHPVAGQGLNLGLRDAWDLAAHWDRTNDPGNAGTLKRYAAQRRLDAGMTIAVTECLARGFTIDLPGAATARSVALFALDGLPVLRKFFARRMIYGSAAMP